MREIKFRIWDKINKTWLDDYVGINNFGVVVNDRDDVSNLSLASNVIIQQYTGLKDKNGREIYEGDIILHEPVQQEWYCRHKCYGKVVWGIGQWIFDYNEGFWYINDRFDYKFAEIVGNIHENPELL